MNVINIRRLVACLLIGISAFLLYQEGFLNSLGWGVLSLALVIGFTRNIFKSF